MNATAELYIIDQVTGYEPNTDDEPGAPIIERHIVTRDELADLLGSDEKADDLIATGTLGQHDEWRVEAGPRFALMDADTADEIGPATAEQVRASFGEASGTGIIAAADGRRVYVVGD